MSDVLKRWWIGLEFFKRTSAQGCWNIASYHSPLSLTWSWIVSIDLRRHRPAISLHRQKQMLYSELGTKP